VTTRTSRRIKNMGESFLKGGLNLTDNAIIVPPHEMVDATNILIGSSPSRRQRPGIEYFNTDDSDENASYPVNPKNGGGTSEPILGAYEFWRYDGTTGAPKATLMVRQGDKIWGIDQRTGLADDLTGALVLPAGGAITFQAFEGRVYWTGTGTSGVDEGYNYWDGVSGSAVAAAAVPPDGTPTHIISHGGRMWAWGVPGFPYRLYYSEFYDAESWAVAAFGDTGTAAEPGSLDMDPFGDPVGINGAVSFQDRLYVFMRRARFEVTGSTINDFFVKTLSRKYGTIGHKTIVSNGDSVFYASERGFFNLASSDTAIESKAADIARPIKSLWTKLLNRNLFDQFCACYDEDENLYLITCPSSGSTANDTILAYSAEHGVWSGVWKGHKARVLTSYFTEGKARVLAGREDGVLALLGTDARTDLGAAYTSSFKTGMLYPGEEIDIEHVWKHATILTSAEGSGSLVVNAYLDSKLVSSQTIQVDAGTDLLGTTFVLGDSELGGGVFIPHTFSLKGQGYGLQLEVIFNSDIGIQVYGFMYEAVPAGSPTRGGTVG
jgi:hypothetical protein